MSMFKSSEFLDEESVQAARLEQSLNKLQADGRTDIDSREDPELGELLAVGAALRTAADEATETSSFKSFHMRSRAAILHLTGDNISESQPSNLVGKILHTVMPVRTAIFSALSGSVATLLAVLLVVNGGNSTNDEAITVEATSSGVTESVVESNNAVQSSHVKEPLQLTVVRRDTVYQDNISDISVAVIDEFSLVIEELETATVVLNNSILEDTVTADKIRNLTDSLAHIGFELRSNHPGGRYETDVQDFQNAIVNALIILRSVEQSDTKITAALIAAKIVAEDTMGITTRYVIANQASR